MTARTDRPLPTELRPLPAIGIRTTSGPGGHSEIRPRFALGGTGSPLAKIEAETIDELGHGADGVLAQDRNVSFGVDLKRL